MEIEDSRCRFELRGLEFLHLGLEVAHSNDVGEVYSLKRQVGDFLEAIRWHWKIRVHRSLTFFFIFDIILILDCIWVAEFSNI